MESDLSIVGLVFGASLIVKAVMSLLLLASIASWALIVFKSREIGRARRDADEFETRFRDADDLTRLFNQINARREKLFGMSGMFDAGYREYARLKSREVPPNHVLEGSQRTMRVALARELERLEAGLPWLATIGSVSPYVGLFGTVWGIMNAFQALGNVNQATLAMVAPGISEALVATAMGLFAAIPAVIGYNRFAATIERIGTRYEIFVEEFASIMQRQVHG